MERNYNETVFYQEESELLEDLVNYLLDTNRKSERFYYDIHIMTDGCCDIVQWVSVPYDEPYNGEFVYKEEDDVIMKEVWFPDNHCEYLFPDEVEDRLKEWNKIKDAKPEDFKFTDEELEESLKNISDYYDDVEDRFNKLNEEEGGCEDCKLSSKPLDEDELDKLINNICKRFDEENF